MSLLPVGIGPQEGGYQIERSLRFNSADSAYLSRTPASAGNRRTWTIAVWAKRGLLGGDAWIYDGGSTSNASGFEFSSDKIRIHSTSSSGAVDDVDVRTTAVYRDPSAWYHIVLAVDTTQATNTNRIKLYVNGSQVTSFSTTTWPTQNYDFGVNNTNSQKIGKWNPGSGRDFDGYMADFYLIDGQQLDPTSFGEYNTDTGVWQPIAYTGSYGTNGFYLDFADNSSTTALGYDAAGSNDWTPNNFSVTAGAGNDSLVDTPTNYGTDTGVGGEVRGNYATLNPLNIPKGGSMSNGNLDYTAPSAEGQAVGTMYASSGKWYWELVQSSGSGGCGFGIAKDTTNINSANLESGAYVYYSNGNKYNASTASSFGSSFTTGDVIGVALDLDSGKVWFAKNGTWQASGNPSGGTNEAFSGLSGNFTALIYDGTGAATPTYTANFGARPFAYTAPSGFKALCTQNLPEPAIADGSTAMNAVLYTGTGSAQSITNVGFQPDLVWIKNRSNSGNHGLVDAVRGRALSLYSDLTSQEFSSGSTQDLTSFDSNGFSVGTQLNFSCNANTNTYVAWNWKAGGTGVSNTAGSITSTVSANTTAGFGIVTYTGNATSGATVGHGLGVAPSMVIVKSRSSGSTGWYVYHTSVGNTKALLLNSTIAADTFTGYWNNTTPSSTVFTLGDGVDTNASGGNFVAYCFAPVAGYSAFGSYTGNGSSDGPFVYTGFRPRWVMVKRTDTANSWYIQDTERPQYNVSQNWLEANASDAEGTSSLIAFDFLSNGFKRRGVGAGVNASGGTYVYACFAENPFKHSLAR